MSRRVVVVGGGVTGLATAWLLRHGLEDHAPPDAEVVVLESAPRLGGKILTVPFAGEQLDVGADAFLARRPEAERLARRLGLGDELVAPRTGQVWLWVDGRLERLPERTVFGVPTVATTLLDTRAVGAAAVARTVAEPLLTTPVPEGDVSVAELVGGRLGREIVDVLVEPLLGGVYAGSTDRLSARATTPVLADAADHPGGLVAGCRAHRRRAASVDAPVFLTVAGGMGRLVAGLAAGLPAGSVRTGVTVTSVEPRDGRWRVTTSAGEEPADAVVVAVPAHVAGGLLAAAAPQASELLQAIDHASVAVVTLAYDRDAVVAVPRGSGMLVPRGQGRLVKAATWSSGKWPHLAAADRWLIRCSVGRIDDTTALELPDDELAERVDAEAREALGITAPAALRRVTRWDRALPQYDVGHLERVAAIRGALPPGLHVAGAAYDGVGIAPCVAQAEEVVRRLP